MGISTHRVRVCEMRKITHPVFPNVNKYWLTVAAKDLPPGISTAANARDPIGLNRRVYKDVRDSLDGQTAAEVGMFDLMNKGITILANAVKMVDKEQGVFDLIVDDLEGGIVDGAHTAGIIWEANKAKTTPDHQYVEVYVRTGIRSDMISEIARGLNTGIQVAPQSIFNKAGIFDWIKEQIKTQPYISSISWNESDAAEYDVRDLIGVLEALNIFHFPNDLSVSKHPIAAYEKWSIPLKKFADDYEENKDNLKVSVYYRLRNLLKDGLQLYDHIRHDFRGMVNAGGGRAGNMKIVEDASERKKLLDFPFAGITGSKYRLTKGATLPILAAFRSYVEVDPKTGDAKWRGDFDQVLRVWRETGPALVNETRLLVEDGYRNPDQLGKNRKHWGTLYMRLQMQVLQERLLEHDQSTTRRHR